MKLRPARALLLLLKAHHAHVRARVLDHLRAKADEYSFFVGDDAEWGACSAPPLARALVGGG